MRRGRDSCKASTPLRMFPNRAMHTEVRFKDWQRQPLEYLHAKCESFLLLDSQSNRESNQRPCGCLSQDCCPTSREDMPFNAFPCMCDFLRPEVEWPLLLLPSAVTIYDLSPRPFMWVWMNTDSIICLLLVGCCQFRSVCSCSVQDMVCLRFKPSQLGPDESQQKLTRNFASNHL
eukprot:189558-Amphidinium_carterae.1